MRTSSISVAQAAVYFVGLAMLGLVMVGCGSTETELSAPSYETVVFLHPETGPTGVESVRDALEPADGIVTFVGQEESFEEFRRFFEGDDVAERVSVSEMPPSLRLRTDGPLAEGLRSDLEAHPAVRAIVEPGSELAEQPDPDPRAGLTIVYLRADAGVAGREAINDVLADYEGRYFVGQEETLEEFRAFYIADSAQIESIAAHQMPPSWRIDLRGDQLDPNVVVALEASSFVREVIQPANE